MVPFQGGYLRQFSSSNPLPGCGSRVSSVLLRTRRTWRNHDAGNTDTPGPFGNAGPLSLFFTTSPPPEHGTFSLPPTAMFSVTSPRRRLRDLSEKMCLRKTSRCTSNTRRRCISSSGIRRSLTVLARPMQTSPLLAPSVGKHDSTDPGVSPLTTGY